VKEDRRNCDPPVSMIELSQRVARLEADVCWLKKMVSTTMMLTLGSFLTLIVMLIKLIGG